MGFCVKIPSSPAVGWLELYGRHVIFDNFYLALFSTPTWGEKYYFKTENEIQEFIDKFEKEDISFEQWAIRAGKPGSHEIDYQI